MAAAPSYSGPQESEILPPLPGSTHASRGNHRANSSESVSICQILLAGASSSICFSIVRAFFCSSLLSWFFLEWSSSSRPFGRSRIRRKKSRQPLDGCGQLTVELLPLIRGLLPAHASNSDHALGPHRKSLQLERPSDFLPGKCHFPFRDRQHLPRQFAGTAQGELACVSRFPDRARFRKPLGQFRSIQKIRAQLRVFE